MLDFLSRECSTGLVLSARLANSRTRLQFPYRTQGGGGTEALLRGPLTPAIGEVLGTWESEGARKRQPGPKHSSCSWLRGQPLNKEPSVPSQRTKTWSTRCGPSDVKKCHIWPKLSMHQPECPGRGSSWATLLGSSVTFRRDECPDQTRLQMALYLLKHQPTLLRPAASTHGTGLEVLLGSSASIPGVTPGGQLLGEDGTQKPWGPYVGREASKELENQPPP